MRFSHLAVAFAAAALVQAARADAAPAPTCAAVQTAFGGEAPYADREAIVDGLQEHLKVTGADKPLGRDGKVQAILLAAMQCDALGHGDFMAALDRTAAQLARERARYGG